jgi:hypothetical protein
MEMAKPIASASLYGPLVAPIRNHPVLRLENSAQCSTTVGGTGKSGGSCSTKTNSRTLRIRPPRI